jgi:hypothetical protein
MLNTRKLIYLLPEVCFITELVPGKKPHTFVIQSFRQINGQFMDEEDLVTENVLKLFNKLEPETYTLILPDFLFTNTIIDVAESDESGVREYLLKKLLPSLGLSKETHQLETFILTQHQNKTKVQLSGLEKSILGPVYDVAQERKITIDAVCPLSWTLKSVISLEPSLSALELGKHIYVAQHYIGVDQSIFFSIDELGNVVESVKTLRGAEPNLQTLYLLTSPQTESELKGKLKQRIPLQQLAEDETSVEGLPAHIKTAIEAAAKTLDIEDYPVPHFTLEKYEATAEKAEVKEEPETLKVEKEEAEPEIVSKPFSLESEDLDEPAKDEETPLPTPKPRIVEETIEEKSTEPISAPTLPSTTTPITAVSAAAAVTPAVTAPVEAKLPSIAEVPEEKLEEKMALPELPGTDVIPSTVGTEKTQFVDKDSMGINESQGAIMTDTDNGDWLGGDGVESDEPEETTAAPAASMATRSTASAVRTRSVIRNRSGSGSLFKMIGITLGALLITVAVGVGIGFVLLKSSEKDAPVNQGLAPTPKASAVVQASPSPVATASASAAPVTIARDKTKILVVNASGVNGLAGKMKTNLTQAGYKTVDTANAKGKYDKGFFALMKTANSELLAQLEKDSKVKVTAGTQDKSVEDPKSAYDVVFVVNDQL